MRIHIHRLSSEKLARLKQLKEDEIERLSYRMKTPLKALMVLEQEGLLWI